MHVRDRHRPARRIHHREGELVAGGVVRPEHGLPVGAVLGARSHNGVGPEKWRDRRVVRRRQESAPHDAERRPTCLER